MATKKKLRNWFRTGVQNDKHWLAVRDDYAFYFEHRENLEAFVSTSVVATDVYDLTAQMEPQIKAEHVWALDPNDPAVKPKPASLEDKEAWDYKDGKWTQTDGTLGTVDVVTPYTQGSWPTNTGALPRLAANITQEQWNRTLVQLRDVAVRTRQVAKLREENAVLQANVETLNVDRQRVFDRLSQLERRLTAIHKAAVS